jgi:hypothetical protein
MFDGAVTFWVKQSKMRGLLEPEDEHYNPSKLINFRVYTFSECHIPKELSLQHQRSKNVK